MYNQSLPLGLPGKGFQGSNYFVAPNPPFGATFTFYLKESIETLKKRRWAAEKEAEGEGGNVEDPSWDALRAEEREADPVIIATVSDEEGNVVRRLTAPPTAGFHRVSWDLRYPPSTPVSLEAPDSDNPFDDGPQGPMAAPGTYTVSFAQRVGGKLTPLGEPQTFKAVPLGLASLPAEDVPAVQAFQQKTARLQRAVFGAVRLATETQERIDYIQKALLDTPRAEGKLADEADALETRLQDLREKLTGNRVVRSHNEADPPSIVERVSQVVGGHWGSSSAPTQTHLEGYRLASQAFAPVLEDLRKLVEVDLKSLEDRLETAGAPWTPGRVPTWKPE
jgi:hypothetical protein